MSNSKKKAEAFREELKQLLIKHNALIQVGYSEYSDTHGVSGEHMSLSVGGDEIKIEHDWYIDKNNI